MSNRSIAALAWLVAMSAIWATFVFNGLSLTVLGWATVVGLGVLVTAARWGSGSARSITTLLDDLEAEPAVVQARAPATTTATRTGGSDRGGEADHRRR
jgi:hypothetical protein